MPKQNFKYDKRQRELAKQRKKEEKRQRRLDKNSAKSEVATEDGDTPPESEQPGE